MLTNMSMLKLFVGVSAIGLSFGSKAIQYPIWVTVDGVGKIRPVKVDECELYGWWKNGGVPEGFNIKVLRSNPNEARPLSVDQWQSLEDYLVHIQHAPSQSIVCENKEDELDNRYKAFEKHGRSANVTRLAKLVGTVRKQLDEFHRA